MASTESTSIPMTPLIHNLLNECRQLQRTLDKLEERHRQLQSQRQNALFGTDSNHSDLYTSHQTILRDYRVLIERTRNLYNQSVPLSTAASSHLSALRRRIESSLRSVQASEQAFCHSLAEQQRRQYAIVRPTASAAELDAAVAEAGSSADGAQIFRQAMLTATTTTRSGEATAVWDRVRQRHDELSRVQQAMEELGELFAMLAQLVERQDGAVREVEKHAEETREQVEKANGHLVKAVDSARAWRRKKWIALGLTVAIIVVIVIVALIVLAVLHVI